MYLSLYVYLVSLFVLYDNFIVLCFSSLLLCLLGGGCVCVHMHNIYIYIYIHACVHLCVHACVHGCMYVHFTAFPIMCICFLCVCTAFIQFCCHKLCRYLFVCLFHCLAGWIYLLAVCVSFNHCLVNLCTCFSEDSCCRIWSWRAVGWSLTRPGFRIGSCPHQQHTMLCWSKTTKQITGCTSIFYAWNFFFPSPNVSPSKWQCTPPLLHGIK